MKVTAKVRAQAALIQAAVDLALRSDPEAAGCCLRVLAQLDVHGHLLDTDSGTRPEEPASIAPWLANRVIVARNGDSGPHVCDCDANAWAVVPEEGPTGSYYCTSCHRREDQ